MVARSEVGYGEDVTIRGWLGKEVVGQGELI